MTDQITTVTVTVVDADCVVAVACSYVSGYETVEQVIEQVMSDALSNFNDEGGSLSYRAIVNVNHVPAPKASWTTVTANIPEGTEAATVTATVA